nr:zinc finger, PMZ-type [Tanacetum cinerariifolium]
DQAFGGKLRKKYVCMLWKLSGVPCIHAVATYMHLSRDPKEGVSHCGDMSGGKGSRGGGRETRGGGRGSRSGGRGSRGGGKGSRVGGIGISLQKEEKEYQEKLDEEAFRQAIKEEAMFERMDLEIERQEEE